MLPPAEVEIWDRTSLDRRKHHRRMARLVFTAIAGQPQTRSIVDAALGDVPSVCPPGAAIRQRRR